MRLLVTRPEPDASLEAEKLRSLALAEDRFTVHVRPELVVEVAFTEWTADGKMRHPKYLGLRDDVRPTQVRREPTGPMVEQRGPRHGPRPANETTRASRGRGPRRVGSRRAHQRPRRAIRHSLAMIARNHGRAVPSSGRLVRAATDHVLRSGRRGPAAWLASRPAAAEVGRASGHGDLLATFLRRPGPAHQASQGHHLPGTRG